MAEEKKEVAKFGGVVGAHIITIIHDGNQALRAYEGKDDVGGRGSGGNYSRWEATLEGGVYKFKNVKTGKYLRMKANGVVDVGGVGKKLCEFKAHYVPARGFGYVRLESQAAPGTYIEVADTPEAAVGSTKTIGPRTIMFIATPSLALTQITFDNERPFYGVTEEDYIMIEHAFVHTLRSFPLPNTALGVTGGKGIYARWYATFMSGQGTWFFQNTFTTKYIQMWENSSGVKVIDCNGNGGNESAWLLTQVFDTQDETFGYFKMQSDHYRGNYIAVHQSESPPGYELAIGTGGPWCNMRFFGPDETWMSKIQFAGPKAIGGGADDAASDKK